MCQLAEHAAPRNLLILDSNHTSNTNTKHTPETQTENHYESRNILDPRAVSLWVEKQLQP